MTTYRDVCGSLRGMIAHQGTGEDPCGWCLQAETAARLGAEAVTWKAPRPDSLEPVSSEQATANRAVLAAEVEEFERGHGAANVVRHLPKRAA
jgi:hypothetical protein